MEFLLWLQDMHTPFLDVFFNTVTFLGDQPLVILVMAWFLWVRDRDFGLRLGMAFFTGSVLAQILKLVFMVPRPWVLDPRIMPDPLAVERATGPSFPSGHTMTAVVLFGTLLLRARKPVTKAMCAFAILLVSLSRLYLLVHTLQDVLTSVVIGGLVVWLLYRIMEQPGPKSVYAAAGIAAALMASLVAVCLYRFNTGTSDTLLKDGWSACGAAAGFAQGLFAARRNTIGQTADTWYRKLAVMGAGLLAAGVLMFGVPLIAGSGGVGKFLTYMLLALWASAVYPALLSKLPRRSAVNPK